MEEKIEQENTHKNNAILKGKRGRPSKQPLEAKVKEAETEEAKQALYVIQNKEKNFQKIVTKKKAWMTLIF